MTLSWSQSSDLRSPKLHLLTEVQLKASSDLSTFVSRSKIALVHKLHHFLMIQSRDKPLARLCQEQIDSKRSSCDLASDSLQGGINLQLKHFILFAKLSSTQGCWDLQLFSTKSSKRTFHFRCLSTDTEQAEKLNRKFPSNEKALRAPENNKRAFLKSRQILQKAAKKRTKGSEDQLLWSTFQLSKHWRPEKATCFAPLHRPWGPLDVSFNQINQMREQLTAIKVRSWKGKKCLKFADLKLDRGAHRLVLETSSMTRWQRTTRPDRCALSWNTWKQKLN